MNSQELTPTQLAVAKMFAAVTNHGHGSAEAKAASAEFMKAFDQAHPEFSPSPEPMWEAMDCPEVQDDFWND